MDDVLAAQLIALDNRFYRVHADSFSRTRQTAWDGWAKAWETARRELGFAASTAGATENSECSVLDLACGNLRFERALAQEAPLVRFCFDAVDCCDELSADTPYVATNMSGVEYHSADILGSLLANGQLPAGSTGAGPHDLSACFGFMHHVPGSALRLRTLQALVDATRPGGIIVVSFWQFMSDERLARKAHTLTQAVRAGELCRELDTAQLDQNDYFLDWQSDSSVLRYCHHTTDNEIDRLLDGLRDAQEIERYSADGRDGNLNRYVILKRN